MNNQNPSFEKNVISFFVVNPWIVWHFHIFKICLIWNLPASLFKKLQCGECLLGIIELRLIIPMRESKIIFSVDKICREKIIYSLFSAYFTEKKLRSSFASCNLYKRGRYSMFLTSRYGKKTIQIYRVSNHQIWQHCYIPKCKQTKRTRHTDDTFNLSPLDHNINQYQGITVNTWRCKSVLWQCFHNYRFLLRF